MRLEPTVAAPPRPGGGSTGARATLAGALAAALDRYRRSGATLPFGDPLRVRGLPLEGWYWRVTEPRAGRVVVVLCGLLRDGDGRTWGLVGLAGHPGGRTEARVVPLARADATGTVLEAGDALRATPGRLVVDLGADARLDLALRDPAAWPRRSLGGLGAAQGAPGLSQYWHPHLLGARVAGAVTLGACTGPLDGGTVYAEKNWGPGFPPWWWWGQAHGFEREDACVAFAGGRVGLGRVALDASTLVVRVGDEVLRCGPPGSLLRTRIEARGWRATGRTPRHRVDVEARANGVAPHSLPVPRPSEPGRLGAVEHHLAGEMRVRVRRGSRLIWDGRSQLAGLEVARGWDAASAPPWDGGRLSAPRSTAA